MVLLGPACLGGGGSNNKPPATLPSAPTSLAADPFPTTARIDLTWIDMADNEFEFRIERSDDGGATWAQVGVVPKNTQGYSDFGLVSDKSYSYRVAAWNGKGYSAFAGPATRKTKALTWFLVPPGASDPAVGLSNHSAIYDPGGTRMVVFGGWEDSLTPKNDVWVFDLSLDTQSLAADPWNLTATQGITAPLRAAHSAVYDSVHHQMVVFGGVDDLFQYSDQVYLLDLDLNPPSWSQPTISGAAPTGRAFHTAVFDSDNQRMMVYGGSNGGTYDFDDVHILTFSSKTSAIWSSPAIGARPVRRSLHAAIYDPDGGRMMVFGGFDQDASQDNSSLNGETWSFSPSASTWTKLLFPGTPGLRMGHSAIYDAYNRRLVTHSGANTVTPTLTDEMWSLRLDVPPVWSILGPNSGSPPSGRSGHSAIYDGGFKRMIIYGGVDDTLTPFNEVWIVDL